MASELLARLANKTANEKNNDVRDNEFVQNVSTSKDAIIDRDKDAALELGQFKVYYQSKHNAANGQLVGAEALVRWDHRTLGLLTPGDFIPAFEANGFIKKLDEYVRITVFKDIQRWETKGYKSIPISINLSRVDFTDRELVAGIISSARTYGIDPARITFEITETATSENQTELVRDINRLRDNGFTVVIDNFGSGYSSLSTLNEIQVDALKIDKDLINQVNNDKKKFLVDTCIKLGEHYDLTTEAEGVETKEQFDMLRSLNCDTVQGFYFARPLPVETFELRLEK